MKQRPRAPTWTSRRRASQIDRDKRIPRTFAIRRADRRACRLPRCRLGRSRQGRRGNWGRWLDQHVLAKSNPWRRSLENCARREEPEYRHSLHSTIVVSCRKRPENTIFTSMCFKFEGRFWAYYSHQLASECDQKCTCSCWRPP